jgi:RNA polymerase sigma-54 factor
MHQSQILAPQLRQSLEMLQLPLMELRAAIQHEMETNPAIEDVQDPNERSIETLAPTGVVTPASEGVMPDAPETPRTKESEAEEPLTFDPDADIDTLTRLDDEWRDYFMQGMENAPSQEDRAEQPPRRSWVISTTMAI